jgi:hypothetical protein
MTIECGRPFILFICQVVTITGTTLLVTRVAQGFMVLRTTGDQRHKCTWSHGFIMGLYAQMKWGAASRPGTSRAALPTFSRRPG